MKHKHGEVTCPYSSSYSAQPQADLATFARRQSLHRRLHRPAARHTRHAGPAASEQSLAVAPDAADAGDSLAQRPQALPRRPRRPLVPRRGHARRHPQDSAFRQAARQRRPDDGAPLDGSSGAARPRAVQARCRRRLRSRRHQAVVRGQRRFVHGSQTSKLRSADLRHLAFAVTAVFRSHEVRQEGFSVEHDGLCVTVFSAPNYVDQTGNKAAFIRVDDAGEVEFTAFGSSPHPPMRSVFCP